MCHFKGWTKGSRGIVPFLEGGGICVSLLFYSFLGIDKEGGMNSPDLGAHTI